MKRTPLSLALVALMLIVSSGCDYSASTQFEDSENAKPTNTEKAPLVDNGRGLRLALLAMPAPSSQTDGVFIRATEHSSLLLRNVVQFRATLDSNDQEGRRKCTRK
jgi:hypothetical protein